MLRKRSSLPAQPDFIASHVTRRLIKDYPDYSIVALDKLDYCSNLKNLAACRGSPNFKFVKGDIACADLVNHLLIAEDIDTIMHFAAQTHVDNSFGNSFEFTTNNIYGTHVLLEACKVTKKIKRFIHVSTDEVYGETDMETDIGNPEASQLLPTNPYSATKAGSYGLPIITTRGNNVYGPNQYPEKLIPKFILLALKGEQLPIHGDGSNVRSFLYCEDVAEAFDVILHKGAIGHVYNIGTKKERRVLDVAEDICNLYGLDPEKSISYVQDRPFNDHRYFLDDQKLKMLGWQESTPWEAGLKMTMEWYTKNPDWWDDISAALHPHPRLSMISHSNDDSWMSQKGLVSDAKEAGKSDGSSGLKFLIYGKTGWIGGLLGKLCKDGGIPFEYGQGRLEDRMSILRDIEKVETIRTNVGGTLTLADVCKEHDLLMMNFATGCIFEYDQDHQEGSGIGFKEEDKPNFTGSFYSKTKAMVEELLREYENVCTLRVRMPISSDLSNPRNFITKITRYSKVVNIPNSMTVLDELLPISIEMAKRNCRGIWNFTNPGVVSHNEILEMYRDYIDPEFKWMNFDLEEQAKVIVAPRSNNELDATKLKNEFPEMLSIKESILEHVFKPNRKT
ncbi:TRIFUNCTIONAL UDP-GLUCOSE 46-DEHYDRATASE/UDP-4-KETO-6-DEOXY-D-GLUCOSE 35-EPIMERASE/UDP-4-KETO-L-RHAMNOSE-REDUCTASE RHM3-LIKE [Salix viminalis]|uniref:TRIFUNCTIONAL UDP-GLUCOSE 46-DEHYDRATASE/UDP-4-KETO-6-DEOXY-D-GLUCOSE 35-EPIMERASE/UDP-4-KETO-L-RHAMNOSE-REDUCTASE RHM3-LIKE n=1 Tax=Salix viminalis TaxID=40686 RepID=A0A9Q0ZR96_SALVM|nr:TRIFUNCTIONAL UDP-GLUCOSE 46-DEHYDRATASE/UDP-4-KETO-6-DEOXY-D-GLUCOSE 35-EPIMERASE/UDP-4-KETO-L-RHAMNOSE-REDUCTASE RHM3-LIKE [Salix viminalis]